MGKVTLIGRDTSLNNTIQEIISNQPDLNCTVITYQELEEGNLAEKLTGADVVIADLTTIHETPVQKIKKISAIFTGCAIIAIHFYTNSKIQQEFRDAGAEIVFTPELSEDELLNAVHSAL